MFCGSLEGKLTRLAEAFPGLPSASSDAVEMSQEIRKLKSEPADEEEEEGEKEKGDVSFQHESCFEREQLGGSKKQGEELGSAISVSCLTMMQSAAETSDELEIIDELIKEDGFELDPLAFPSRVLCHRPPRLLPRCSSLASSPGMQRPAGPSGMSPVPFGLELDPLRISCHPASCAPQEPSASQLSHTLDNLTLQPQLVSRGTSLPLLPSSRCSDTSWPASAPSLHLTVAPEQLNDISREPPKLVITEQPKQRGMRFRYQCEGRSAGSILGEFSTDTNKTLPTIELQNFEGISEVKVTACLVWKDWPHRIHPHSLVGKDCSSGLCEVILKPRMNPKHSFNNLGIQCVKKKDIEDSIDKKLQLGIDPFKAGSLKNHQEVDMNVVRICFQASYQDHAGETQHLSPVLSEPIYDKKSTNTSELKIYRMNKEYGSCAGGEELYLLCDKVQKEDISIIFRKDSWEGKADFSQADVHRQIAIVFKTPPYQHLDIPEPVEVEVYLRRLTDSVSSDPFNFTYLPKDNDTYRVNKKRKQGMPDVLEELSGPDPHGIEAKRKRKKPGYMDHFNLTPSAAGSFSHPEEMSFLDNLERITVPEPFEDYTLLQDFSSYSGPSLSDVLLPSCMDFPGTTEHEFPLDNYSVRSGVSASFLLPGECDPEGTASLVGSSMFPSQYKEAEAKMEMEAKLKAADASKTL